MRRDIQLSLELVALLLLLIIVPNQAASAQQAVGNYNYVLNPNVSGGYIATTLDTFVNVGATIQGTSSNSGALGTCSSSISYLWDYQNNILQLAELGNSWIQQVVEVGNGGSCYGIWFFPDVVHNPNSYSFYDLMIYSCPSGWSASNSQVQFEIDSNSGAQYDTVYQFVVNLFAGNCDTGETIDPYQVTSSSITYDGNSIQDFNIVGTGDYAVASFTAGTGTINYCGVTPLGGNPEDQTGENSNMGYGTIGSSSCPGGAPSPYYQQSFYAPYYLTMGHGFGIGTVPSASGYYAAYSQVIISATQGGCIVTKHIQWIFTGWTGSGPGSYSGTSTSATITMNGNINEYANSEEISC